MEFYSYSSKTNDSYSSKTNDSYNINNVATIQSKCTILDNIKTTTEKPLYIIDSSLRLGAHVSFQKSILNTLKSTSASYCIPIQTSLSNMRTLKSCYSIPFHDAKDSLELLNTYNRTFYSHFPYVGNFAYKAEEVQDSIERLDKELLELEKIQGTAIVHPGTSKIEPLSFIVDNLGFIKKPYSNASFHGTYSNSPFSNPYSNAAFDGSYSNNPFHNNHRLLIENSSAEGTKVPKNLEQTYHLLRRLPNVGFCLDTCHAFAAGWCDFKSVESFLSLLNDLDKTIGPEKLQCIHLNDAKSLFGSHLDRHADFSNEEGNMFRGTEGLSVIACILSVCSQRGIDIIRETKCDSLILEDELLYLRSVYNGDSVNRRV